MNTLTVTNVLLSGILAAQLWALVFRSPRGKVNNPPKFPLEGGK